jgi:TolB protein
MTTEARDPRVRELVFELVDAAPDAPPFPAAALAEQMPEWPRRPRSLLVAALAALLVVGTVGAVLLVRRTPEHGPLGAPVGAATVAYVDARGLVVRTSPGEETVVARGAVSAPRWSPSGDWLAYREDNEVWVVRADGSARRLIGKLDGFAWSPTVDALAVTDQGGVRVWSMQGPTPESVTINPPVGGIEHDAQSFAWSRDGTSLAIEMERRDHAGPGAPVASLWIARGVCRMVEPGGCSTPSAVQQIPYTPGANDYPLLVAGFGFDDTQLLFWSDYIGSSSIMMDGLPLRAVPVHGGRATNIGTTIVRNDWVQPSPDGSRLLVVRSSGRMVTDSREVELCTASDACRPIAPAPDVQTLDPAWSPDGQRIAFVRETQASFTPPLVNNGIDWTVKYRNRSLWVAKADGSDAHEVVAAGRGIADPQFSPDGQSIVFVRDARVWDLDLASGNVVPLSGSLRPTTGCTFEDCLPDVAPYEGTNLWSDHYAVKFAAALTRPIVGP